MGGRTGTKTHADRLNMSGTGETVTSEWGCSRSRWQTGTGVWIVGRLPQGAKGYAEEIFHYYYLFNITI